MNQEALLLLPLWYVVFLLSITCHEAAHALAAWRGGDSTAYVGGQVSLNPLPHVMREPFGTVIVPLLSFLFFGASGSQRWMIGWASAPYDPLWEDRYPQRAALMAAAGPLANLALCVAGLVALKVGLGQGVWSPAVEGFALDRLVHSPSGEAGLVDGFGRFCSVLFSLNLVLFLFNLIPLPPMDGSAIVAGLVPAARRLRERLGASPMLGLVGLLVAWQVFPYVFGPIFFGVVGWLYG